MSNAGAGRRPWATGRSATRRSATRRWWTGRSVARRWIAVAAIAGMVAGCSSSATPAPSIATPSPAPAAASSSASTATLASGDPSFAAIVVDPGLLHFLPATIEAISISFSSEATREVIDDPTLARNAESLAYGMAGDPTSGDVVVAAVAKLRSQVMTEAFFRGWRSSYDKAACAQAGGVGGNAEAQLGGRTVYIATCNGGARTYHSYLEAANVLVSATSVGSRRFGEQLLSGLRP